MDGQPDLMMSLSRKMSCALRVLPAGRGTTGPKASFLIELYSQHLQVRLTLSGSLHRILLKLLMTEDF